MYTNSDLTIYNKYYDKELKKDVYNRHIIRNVFYEERLAVNRLSTGAEASDKVLVLIPMSSLNGYIQAKGFTPSIDTFTIQIGDRVVRNAVTYDIIDKPSELDELFNTFTVHSIDHKDFGSEDMRHIELGLR